MPSRMSGGGLASAFGELRGTADRPHIVGIAGASAGEQRTRSPRKTHKRHRHPRTSPHDTLKIALSERGTLRNAIARATGPVRNDRRPRRIRGWRRLLVRLFGFFRLEDPQKDFSAARRDTLADLLVSSLALLILVHEPVHVGAGERVDRPVGRVDQWSTTSTPLSVPAEKVLINL